MDIPEDASFWLGQRNAAHGFFKVGTAVQNVPMNVDACPDL